MKEFSCLDEAMHIYTLMDILHYKVVRCMLLDATYRRMDDLYF